MVLFLAALFAYADAPNRVVETFDSGGTSIQALATSDDGSLIAAATSSGVAFIDTSTWQTSTWTGCDASGVALQRINTSQHVAYVGCDDGLVRVLDVAGERPTLDTSRDAEVPIDSLYAVHWDVNAMRLYVLGESSLAFTPTLHVVEEEGAVDPTGFPVAVQLNGYVDSVISGTTMFIAHGGDNLSTYTLGSAFVTSNQTFSPYSISDLAPSIRDSAYGTDTSGIIIEYTGIFAIAIPSIDDDADAVGASDWADDEWLLVSRGTDVEVYDLTNGAATDSSAPTTSFDAGTTLSDVVIGRIGYAFGVAGSDVVVMTANPWVDNVAVSPSDAETGDELTLTFTTDTDVDYDVRLGSATGTVLAEGSSVGGDETTVTLTVDGTYEEGVNDLVVVATDSSSRQGTRSAQVSVDNPPPAPVLTTENVGFANGAAIVEFGDPVVDDLATYTVYVTTTPFEPSDFATGGPAFTGADELTTPISVDVVQTGETTLRVSPLTNDVTYYIAARAVDAGGQESPMSAAVPVTPRETTTALQRSGEEGGYACSHVPLGALGLPLLLVGALTRRRRTATLTAVAALGIVALPAQAQESGPVEATTTDSNSDASAEEEEEGEPWWKLGLPEDETEAHWNVELHYGTVSMQDTNLVSGYGATTDIFQAEFGPQFFQVAELDFGVGYYREKGNLIADDGQPSSEQTRFSMIPLNVGLTLRLHLLDEQPFVPFIRAGLDYTLFSEQTIVAEAADDAEEAEEVATNGARGSKAGWHWAVGGQLLLDTFARGRASKLEAGSGINDTWLVVEWRFVSIDPDEKFLWAENPIGLDLSRSQLTVGLKLDF